MHILITVFYFLTAPSFSTVYPVGASMGPARSTSLVTRKFAFGCAFSVSVLGPQMPYRVVASTPTLLSPLMTLRRILIPSWVKFSMPTALVSLKSLSHLLKYYINLFFLFIGSVYRFQYRRRPQAARQLIDRVQREVWLWGMQPIHKRKRKFIYIFNVRFKRYIFYTFL